jgi:hypothetical protein
MILRSLLFTAAITTFAAPVLQADFNLDHKYAGEEKPNNKVWRRTGPTDKVVCMAWDDKAPKDAKACVVKYASPTERKMFLFEVKKGKLLQAGRPMDSTPKKMTDSPFYIFVEAPDGTFYASPVDKVGTIHHSTFLAGGPVKTAGEMKIVAGVLKSINNASGHYKPSAASTNQALLDLKALGVPTKGVTTADITKGAH